MGQHFTDMRAMVQAAGAASPTGIAAGVRIATRWGLVAAGDLVPGDDALTRDSGYRPIRRIEPLGLLPCADLEDGLWLHPDHGVLRRNAAGEELLIPGRQLFAPETQRLIRHLMLSISFDRHEVILAEGVWIESARVLSGIPARPRAPPRPLENPGPMRKIRVAGGGQRA